jgi:hypothetical protein
MGSEIDYFLFRERLIMQLEGICVCMENGTFSFHIEDMVK